jgi:hypothetical protein
MQRCTQNNLRTPQKAPVYMHASNRRCNTRTAQLHCGLCPALFQLLHMAQWQHQQVPDSLTMAGNR